MDLLAAVSLGWVDEVVTMIVFFFTGFALGVAKKIKLSFDSNGWKQFQALLILLMALGIIAIIMIQIFVVSHG